MTVRRAKLVNDFDIRPVLHLISGGAAVYRCDNCAILTAALAAEVTRS